MSVHLSEKTKTLRLAPRTGATLLLALLAACGGIEAASDFTARAAYRASFQQIPLVARNPSPGRVLKMYVYHGTGGSPRSAEEVRFNAGIGPK